VRRRITANLFKAFVLVGFLAALAGGVGWLIGRERSAALFTFCALLAAIAVYWLGDRALLGMLSARPFALAEDPLLRSATDRVAAQLQVASPKLCLIDDGFPRAFVVGRGPGSATLAVSTGLLRAVRRDELEAIVAHELAHVRSLDVLTQTFAVLLSTTLVEASRLGGFLSRALLFVLAPIGAAFTHALLSPKREFAADRDAAAVCDPHVVADALLRLDRASELVTFAASPTTEPLYPVDPFEHDRLSRMFHTHPPLAERIRRLRALGIAAEERGS
jgi:heat shock protein HtpX